MVLMFLDASHILTCQWCIVLFARVVWFDGQMSESSCHSLQEQIKADGVIRRQAGKHLRIV